MYKALVFLMGLLLVISGMYFLSLLPPVTITRADVSMVDASFPQALSAIFSLVEIAIGVVVMGLVLSLKKG